MFKPKSKWRFILSGIYGGICALSLGLTLETIHADGLAAFPSILVTLPWSMILFHFIESMASPKTFTAVIPLILIVCASGMLNIYILYWLGSLFDQE